MQPYFLPYLGYWQLISSVDVFVVYDDIKMTKKGWVNRNRLLRNGEPAWFTLPLQADHDALDIRERKIAREFEPQRMLNQFAGAYSKAPHFRETVPIVNQITNCDTPNLFEYLYDSIVTMANYLGIETDIRVSSSLGDFRRLKAQTKVLAICQALKATTYVNAIGGTELYQRAAFDAHDIELRFLKSHQFVYPQFGQPFVPALTIVDPLMFNPLATVQQQVRYGYQLIAGA